MKSTAFTLLIFFLVSGISAQICGTDQASLLKRVADHKQRLRYLSLGEEKYIPVTFHLIADGNGDNRVSEENIFLKLHQLNQIFYDQDITLYINKLNYINDDSIVNRQASAYADQLMTEEKDTSSLNVFIPNVINHGDNNFWLGFYYFGFDWISIRKDNVISSSNTLQHEIGHFLSLPHTHAGWDCNPYTIAIYGNPVMLDSTIACDKSGYGKQLIELQDGSNCDNAGDLICDTPPDYRIPAYIPSDCSGNTLIMDKNGDLITPPIDNIMSYYWDECRDFFSAGQKDLMNTDYFSAERQYIRTGNIPDTSPVEGPVTYISPINGDFTPGPSQIELDWEDTPGANQYMILLSRVPSFTVNPVKYFSATSSITLNTTLVEGVSYYWKVWPYNESQTGAGYSPTQNFHVGNSVGVADLAQMVDWILLPNPIKAGQESQINFNAITDFEPELIIFDLSGKILISKRLQVPHGESTFALETRSFTPGIYYLILKTDQEYVSEKLVVLN